MGSAVIQTSRPALTVKDGWLVARIYTRHYCRAYQGMLKTARLKIANERGVHYDSGVKRAGFTNCNTAIRLCRASWAERRIFSMRVLVAACRGRTGEVTKRAVFHVSNTCGSRGRHTRTGRTTFTIRLQCQPARVKGPAVPVRWRYTCSGRHMYIEGTSRKSVEKTTATADVYCVYRAP